MFALYQKLFTYLFWRVVAFRFFALSAASRSLSLSFPQTFFSKMLVLHRRMCFSTDPLV